MLEPKSCPCDGLCSFVARAAGLLLGRRGMLEETKVVVMGQV